MLTVVAALAAGAAISSASVANSTDLIGAVRVATALGSRPRMQRSRRTCHAVPGSNERFLAKAPALEADEVFLDLEDAVAASEKDRARELVIAALGEHDFGGKTVVVRVNGTDTPHYYRDLIDGRRAGGLQDRRGDAPEGAHARRRRDDRQAAHPDRARARAAGRADRHRGADRGRDRPDRLRGDRRRVGPDGDADLRPRRLQRRGRHPDHDDRRRARGLPGRPPQLRLLAPGRGRPRGGDPGDRRAVRGVRRRRGPARALAARAGARDGRQVDHPPAPDRRSSTRSSRPRARSGSAPRRCSPPTAAPATRAAAPRCSRAR